MASLGIIAGILSLSAVALLNLSLLAFVALRVWLALAPKRQRLGVRTTSQQHALAPAHH